MTRRSKLALGLLCLAVGCGLLLWNGAAIVDSLTQARSGIPLLNLAGCVVGLFGLGVAADAFGRPRPSPKPKENIAKSIWATRGHVDRWDIGEH
jgi:hypothetical protein